MENTALCERCVGVCVLWFAYVYNTYTCNYTQKCTQWLDVITFVLYSCVFCVFMCCHRLNLMQTASNYAYRHMLEKLGDVSTQIRLQMFGRRDAHANM